MLWVRNVGAVMVERRHTTNQARQDGHRVRIAAETTQKILHLFIDHGVTRHQIVKVLFLLRIG